MFFFTIVCSLHFCDAPVQLTMTADRLICDVMWCSFRNLTCRIVHKWKAYFEIFTKISSIQGSLSETESSIWRWRRKNRTRKKDRASNQFEDDLLEPYADEPLVGRRMAQKLQARAGRKQRTGESWRSVLITACVADWWVDLTYKHLQLPWMFVCLSRLHCGNNQHFV